MLPTADGLRHAEAIELGYALVSHVASVAGVRALSIKGLAHSFHGLRRQRTPADVDVLVDPDAFGEFAAALEARGWVSSGELAEPHAFVGHASTFRHEKWSCPIDVHRRFPGFLAPPQVVFDALWASRVAMPVAGQLAPIPGRAGSTLILALHSLRTRSYEPARLELESLIAASAALSDAERDELGALAITTGSAHTLERELARMGVQVHAGARGVQPLALREWRILVDSGFAPADVWLSQLASARWRERPRIVWRALWPPSDELRVMHPEIGRGTAREVAARVGRWGRALAAAPRALNRRLSDARREK